MLRGGNLELHIEPLAKTEADLLLLLEPQKPSMAMVYIRMFNQLIVYRKYWSEVEEQRFGLHEGWDPGQVEVHG